MGLVFNGIDLTAKGRAHTVRPQFRKKFPWRATPKPNKLEMEEHETRSFLTFPQRRAGLPSQSKATRAVCQSLQSTNADTYERRKLRESYAELPALTPTHDADEPTGLVARFVHQLQQIHHAGASRVPSGALEHHSCGRVRPASTLSQQSPLDRVTACKARRAVEAGRVLVPVRDLRPS